jgi:hypothetical protein
MLDSYFILLTTSQFQEKPSQKGKAGRPPGSSKRQKVAEQENPRNNSPMIARLKK